MESDPRSGSPRLLVLGAGPAQLGLLEAARERGAWIAAVDRDAGAPGFRLADRRCILSTEDEPAIERLAGALAVDGIIAPGTDWPVGVAARVAERRNLPHPVSPQTAVLATNKLRQRERLAERGVPQPRWWVIGADDPPPPAPGDVVVKAPDRQGQKGLTLVRGGARLDAAIATARTASRSGLALVEELVDGPELTVIGLSVAGEFRALAVTDRLVAGPPAFGVALAHVWPSTLAEDGLDHAAAEVAALAVAALGIADGPSYAQLRLAPDGPQVIEVAARLGGGHDAELVRAVTGVDLNGLAIEAAVGAATPLPEPVRAAVGGAATRFLVAPAGRLVSVSVPERPPGIERVRIYREAGHVFGELRRGSDRAGAVLAVGATRGEAVERAERAAAEIRFEVEPAAGA